MTTWRSAAVTDVGLVRDVNEDSVHVDHRLAIVADGMGGHAAGEVASALAVEVIIEGFHRDGTQDGVLAAVRLANQRIIEDAELHPERQGMGTTAVALALVSSGEGYLPVVVNIGDSRAYQLRDGALRRITTDHSVAEEWLRQGRLTAEEAEIHPRRHQLTRTLGFDRAVQPDVYAMEVQPGDRVLLCSDGLSNELSDSEIAALACDGDSLDAATTALINAANRNGGRDNISVVLVEFEEVSARPALLEFASAAAVTAAAIDPSAAAEPPVSRPAARAAAKRQRKVSWRTIGFIGALGALVGLVFIVLAWYAQSSFYLANDKGHIAVYQGQPGGVLWYKPVKILDTNVPVNELRGYDRVHLAQTIPVPSIAAGITLAAYYHRAWQLALPTTTTTTAPGNGTGG